MSTSISARQFGKAVDTLEEKGVTGEVFQDEFLGNGRLADLAEAVVLGTIPDRDAFRALLGLPVLVLRLLVDYAVGLSERIRRGAYDWTHSEITETNFPSTGKVAGEVESKLFHFNRDMSSEAVVAEMKRAGFVPADLDELLHFGEKNPDVQRKFPVVGLGSSCVLRGDRHVPILYGGDSRRDLDLNLWAVVWYSYYRFLGVRNKN